MWKMAAGLVQYFHFRRDLIASYPAQWPSTLRVFRPMVPSKIHSTANLKVERVIVTSVDFNCYFYFNSRKIVTSSITSYSDPPIVRGESEPKWTILTIFFFYDTSLNQMSLQISFNTALA